MKGTPFALSPRSRSMWISSMRIVDRSPRIPPPMRPDATRENSMAALSGARGREVRRHLLVHARDDLGNRFHTLREDGDDELAAVEKNDAGDEVVEVEGVAGLGPDAASRRKSLGGQAGVLGLHLLEFLRSG